MKTQKITHNMRHNLIWLLTSLMLRGLLDLAEMSLAVEDTWTKKADMPKQKENSGIRPYEKNPFYWQYKGEPVVLIGGSDTDNLFQWAGEKDKLSQHLDLLKSAGGNYVRNTMSSRNRAHPYNDDGMAYPFKKREDGKYHLDEWDEEYWNRLETFLEETSRRGIIVQLEIWDMWAFVGPHAWAKQPWNPRNNVNYTYEETSLNGEVGWSNNFFLAVPALNNDPMLMFYQTEYIRKILQICLQYDHILYQIDNESPFPFEVSDYWANFIHMEADKKRVYVCDSRRFHEPIPLFKSFRDRSNPEISHPLSLPNLYNYADISQNGGNEGQTHYDNLVWYREQLLDSPRPINHTKIYSFTWPTGVSWKHRTGGSVQEAADRFWRTIFGGGASARHHRYDPEESVAPGEKVEGIGLTPFGQTQLRSMRMLLDAIWVFSMEPHNDLLSSREENEAYALAESGRQYVVYFTGFRDGSVQIDLSAVSGNLVQRWLDICQSSWQAETMIQGGTKHALSPPGSGQWAVLISGRRNNEEQ